MTDSMSSALPLTRSGCHYPVRRSPSAPPSTLFESFVNAASAHPHRPFLGSRASNATPYTYFTYEQSWSNIRSLAISLRAMSPPPATSTLPIILMPNCPNWMLVTSACYSQSWPTAPLYSTLGTASCLHILQQTQSTVYFVDHRMIDTLLEALSTAPPNTLPKATLIVCNGSLTVAHHKSLKAKQTFAKITNLASLFTSGDARRHALYSTCQTSPSSLHPPHHPCDHTYMTPPVPSTPCSISYTSGTTSTPKGVLLTHSNLLSLINAFVPTKIAIDSTSHHFSYLPLPHIFERAISTGMASHGGTISFIRYHPDPKIQGSFLVEDLTACRPTIFCAAPRVLNKIKGNVELALEGEGGMKRLMRHVFASKISTMERASEVKSVVYDPLLNKVAKKLGLDRVTNIVCGSAPIDPSSLAFFAVLLPKCTVLEGYGLTETSGGVSVTSPALYPDYRQFGTVGEPVVGCDVKLVALGEASEGLELGSERGEIWVRGPNVSEGYFDGVDDAGRMKIVSILDSDGWFRTGDVGVWDADTGGLKIVDRIKNIFKLQQGEFVSVEKIEGVVTSNVTYVDQVFCYGDPMRRFIVAVVVVDEKWKAKWGAEVGEMESKVQEDVYKACKRAGLQGFECVRAVRVAAEGFTSANGLATPTFKLVRNKLKLVYKEDVELMYQALDESASERSKL